MNLGRCRQLSHRPPSGHWLRAINLKFWKFRLSTAHTQTQESRFCLTTHEFTGHRMLYLAENHQVALYEVGGLFGHPIHPVVDPKTTWIILSLEVGLSRVVDLGDEGQRAIIGTTFQELTGIWDDSPEPSPTQALGLALYRLPKPEGFLYPSARVGGRNLVIFPDKLDRRSSITFRNDLDGTIERLT